MNLWLILVITGLITYAIRLSFILFFGNREIPGRLQRILRFVPAAVLSALVFPDVLFRENTLFLSPLNFRLLAAVLAILVAWRTRNTLITLVSGMAALWIFQAVIH